ncbi:Ubiquinone biosynthesis protein coq9, mitochondrial [Cystobasidiomycetes sp. EMM_F5]
MNRRVGSLAQSARHFASSSSIGSASQDIRAQLLTAALEHIPRYGFSLKAIQTAANADPSFKSFASSPVSIEQLFPSAPPRVWPSLPSFLSKSPRRMSQEDDESPAEIERLGPIRALFDAWTEQQREVLQGLSILSGPNSVNDALIKRLEMNVPVLPYLPRISESRIATTYSLSELYQTGPTSPTIEQTQEFVDRTLKATAKYDGLYRDTAEFGGYVVQSWKNILKSRGL